MLHNENFIGIIPSGGCGVRMKPFRALKELTNVGYRVVKKDGMELAIPKVLGEYTLENMLMAGVHNIVFVINENKGELIKFYGNGKQYNSNICYVCQDLDSKLYGMPVAFEDAYAWLRGKIVLMGMPDTIIVPANCFEKLLEVYEEKKADLVLGVFKTEVPQSLAPVEYDNDTMRVLKIYDKPQKTVIYNTWNIAVWSEKFTEMLHQYVLDELEKKQEKKEIYISDVFNLAIENGLEVFCNFFSDGNCFDLGNVKEFNSIKNKIEQEFGFASEVFS